MSRRRGLLVAAVSALLCSIVPDAPARGLDGLDGDHWLKTLSWRCIGPSRGGRSSSVAGVPGDPVTYYTGACGGGVWKTTNAGVSWRNVSDGFLGTGSIGSIAVAASDPNVIYAGTGEPDIRGNFSHGDGVYRSRDAGKTWVHVGLDDTRQIGRIAVHPADPDLVYVAALGHVFGPNSQRGLYRSYDGGDNWKRVLFVNERTGAVDVSIDPVNPRVIYAGFWQTRRTPWSLESGGAGSGLYRSRDGGDTWEALTNGLPEGIKGKIGVSASAAQRDLVYAIIEAEDGGVFRSDDGGDSWQRVSEDRNLRQRAWYYTRIYADTQHADTVYVMNVGFHKSTDGGRTYSRIRVPHGDNHDLWIAPENNRRLANANDGGANVSFDGGATWSRQDMQPTAQFYHVATDTNFPYRVLGAQQDNSTLSVSSRNRLGRWQRDSYSVGGGESGYIAPHPENPDIVYAGSYGGYLTRYDHRLRKTRNITVWPENPMGSGAGALVHRFQWTFPIVISPHDPDVLYVGGESLFMSTDEGQSWETISPDLTTNDPTRQRSSGGPITKDNTSVEYYCTIFTVAESPLEEGLIWVGSDDGLVHVTGDGGETWTNVTPPDMGDWPLISLVEASPHDADAAWLAVNRYKMDDFAPYVYRTTDRGATWDLVVDGIDDGAFVRAVREDPERPGLLYAGTELGVFVSTDHGAHWHPLQLDLPVVPITDLVVKGDDLVLATQGRSFWILPGLSLLRQLEDDLDDREPFVFAPAPTYRQGWDSVSVHYFVPERLEEKLALEFRDGSNAVIRSFPIDEPEPGMHVHRWNMRHEDPERVPGAVGWPGTPPGPLVPPGEYAVRLVIGDDAIEQPFEILPDPRVETTPDDFVEQYEFVMEISSAVNEAHRAVNTIRTIRRQVDETVARAKKVGSDEPLQEQATAIGETLTSIEETIIQTRSKSSQDPLNFPVKLNDKIGALQFTVENDFPVTDQARRVFERLQELLAAELERLRTIVETDVPEFNRLVREQEVPAVIVEEKK